MTATGSDIAVLETGDIEVLGLVPYASNYTFLARVRTTIGEVDAIYKPVRGERPLWDFPPGTLAAREVAAFLVSELGGFDLVPPTVLREQGPLGKGSLQLFVDHDPDRHYFVLAEERLEDFALLAAFDVVVNNADRKAGHVLEDRDGRLWAVDHGVTFHEDPKLRTVIWEFADQPLGSAEMAQLEEVRDLLGEGQQLRRDLAALLTPGEAAATLARVNALLSSGKFPKPGGARPLPWPLV